MPRGSRKAQMKNKLDQMEGLGETFIKVNDIEDYIPNTLENQIKLANDCVEFHNFYVDNAKNLTQGCFSNPNDYKVICKSGNYLKSKARLLKKLQERRDKKK